MDEMNEMMVPRAVIDDGVGRTLGQEAAYSRDCPCQPFPAPASMRRFVPAGASCFGSSQPVLFLSIWGVECRP